jgi:hypothetical protein
MEISEEALKEFIEIYEEEFGEDITDREAREIAQRLIGLLLLIYRPIPKEKESDENPDVRF